MWHPVALSFNTEGETPETWNHCFEMDFSEVTSSQPLAGLESNWSRLVCNSYFERPTMPLFGPSKVGVLVFSNY